MTDRGKELGLSSLDKKKCQPCEGGVEPLAGERATGLLAQVPGWRIDADGKAIFRQYQFPDFDATMLFVNGLAWVANQQEHHPDFEAGFGHCRVSFTTHAIGGLSENDFICAARLNALTEI